VAEDRRHIALGAQEGREDVGAVPLSLVEVRFREPIGAQIRNARGEFRFDVPLQGVRQVLNGAREGFVIKEGVAVGQFWTQAARRVDDERELDELEERGREGGSGLTETLSEPLGREGEVLPDDGVIRPADSAPEMERARRCGERRALGLQRGMTSPLNRTVIGAYPRRSFRSSRSLGSVFRTRTTWKPMSGSAASTGIALPWAKSSGVRRRHQSCER
jgi:hypothetical protein